MKKNGISTLKKRIFFIIIFGSFISLMACKEIKKANDIKIYTFEIDMGNCNFFIDTLYNMSDKQGTFKLIYELDSIILVEMNDSINFGEFNLVKVKNINDSIAEYTLSHNLLEISSQIFCFKGKGIVYYENYDSGKKYRVLKKQIINSKGNSTQEFSSIQNSIDSVKHVGKQMPEIFIDSGLSDTLEIIIPE